MRDEKKTTGQDQPHHHTKREADTEFVLGIFLSIIALPVLLGTFWADRFHAMVVNAVAGLVLLGIGIGLTLWGWITSKKT